MSDKSINQTGLARLVANIKANFAQKKFTWLLQGGTEFPDGADLNTYTQIGNYYSSTNAKSTTLINFPGAAANSTTSTAVAGLLKVFTAHGGSYIAQEFKNYSSGYTWYRYTTNPSSQTPTWSAWTNHALDNSKLPLAGGTMTGAITLGANKYFESNNVSGMNVNNSDIIGLNGVYWNDACDAQSEGLNFPRDSTHWDSLRAYSGKLLFTPNRPKGGTGADQEVFTIRPYEAGTTDAIMVTKNSLTRPNRLAFLPADQIIIEKTTDGGTTWVDAGVSDANKAAIFSGTVSGTASIPLLNGAKSELCGLRITFTAMRYNVPEGTSETERYNYWNSTYALSAERYCNLRYLWFWVNANADTIRVKAYRATGANPNTWSQIFNTDFGMTGWSGSDWISFSGGTFGGSTTQTGNTWNWRLEFFSRIKDGQTAFQSTTAQQINKIFGYGENAWAISNPLMYHDHIYNLDANGVATFPYKIVASGGVEGNVTGNATGSASRLKASSMRPNTANISHVSGDYGTVQNFLACSNMSASTKPSFYTSYGLRTANDAHILHFAWDNGGSYNAQIALKNNDECGMSIRGCNTGNVWGNWEHVATSGNCAAGSTNGTVKIAGTDVAVQGLAALAYKASLEATDIPNLDASKITTGTVDRNRLPEFAGDHSGLVPSSSSYDSTKFLRGDGEWASPVDCAIRINTAATASTAVYPLICANNASPSSSYCYEGAIPTPTARRATLNMGTGELTAASFSGSGASITNLDASNISSGTVPVACIPTLDSDKISVLTDSEVLAILNAND